LPLGVEKWQGTVALLAALQGKGDLAARTLAGIEAED
jgi:hypothetical protein